MAVGDSLISDARRLRATARRVIGHLTSDGRANRKSAPHALAVATARRVIGHLTSDGRANRKSAPQQT
jgi:hypothetical protein